MLRFYRKVLTLLLVFSAFSNTVHAAEYSGYLDNLDVRPDIGYGYAVAKDHKRGLGYNAGVRILSSVRTLSTSEPNKRYGVEISSVSPFESKEAFRHEKYVAVGLIVEQILPSHMVITMGTLGYIGVDQNKNSPFGLIADIAWEPGSGKCTQPFLGLRLETIYDTSTITRYSLNAGIKFNAL